MKKLTCSILACAFAVGCATSSSPQVNSSDTSGTSYGTSHFQLVTPPLITPRSPEAAATIKSRGDAAAFDGEFLYRGASAGLVISRIDGDNLFEVSTLHLPGAVSDIAVDGTKVFVACGPSGIGVVDTTEPASPKLITWIDTNGSANRLSIEGELLAIADGSMGALVMDISQIQTPKLIAALDSFLYARDVVLAKDHLYIAADKEGLLVATKAKNNSFALVARIDTPGSVRSVQVAENGSIAIADGAAGVAVLEASSPAGPVEIARIAHQDIARDALLLSNRLYVAGGDPGLLVYTLSPQGELAQSSSLELDTPVNRLALGPKGRILLGNDALGLVIVATIGEDPPSIVYPPSKEEPESTKVVKSVSTTE